MHKLEPFRIILTALVSDLDTNHVILLRKDEDGGTQLVNQLTASLAEASSFLNQVVLVYTRYCPPVSVFPSHLGPFKAGLATQRTL